MSLTIADIKKIAHLARLNMSEDDLTRYAPQLSNILNFVEQMNQAQEQAAEPLAHQLNVQQRLRDDVVSETNQRDLFQSIAPQTEAGLYLVPKVIE